MKLLSSDSELYASFYDLVGMGARRPEDTSIELQRLLADDLLFPHYRAEIRFAALSLDGRGITRFGECSLVLKEGPIQNRTTVFEENSVYFGIRRDLGLRHHMLPTGFRATWGRRDQLAAAKLEPLLQPGMKPDAFPGILLRLGMRSEDDGFIEVHIYGRLHRMNVQHLAIAKPKQRADRAMLKQLEAHLKSIGATIEIYA